MFDWKSLAILALIFAAITVSFAAWGAIPGSVDRQADSYCSPPSIAISDQELKNAVAQYNTLKQSLTARPEAILLAKTNALLATIALENLVTRCAILKKLEGATT